MKLLVHELASKPVKQKITALEDIDLVSIRPHLYIQGNPAGSIKLRIEDQNERLICETETISIASITTAGYFHGSVRFNGSVPIRKDSEYYVSLIGVGYSYNPTAFIGWCNDYDLRRVSADYSPNSAWYAALDLELWQNRRR